MVERTADIAPKEAADPGLTPLPESRPPALPDEQEVLEAFNARFKTSRDHHEQWRDEARTLYDLICGRQWADHEVADMEATGRPFVTFNVAGKYLDSISGLQVNNRQKIKYYPREQGDVQVNELLTSAVDWGRDLTDVADDETDAFYDAVLTGYGWMQGYLDRDLVPEGVPTAQRIDPLQMYPDPAARKRNLTDARYLIRLKFVSRDEYEELTGATVVEDTALAEVVAEEDDVLRHIEEPQDYRGNSAAAGRTRSRLPVAEYEWWRYEQQMSVQAKDFGQTVMEMNEWEVYEQLLKRARAEYRATPVNVKVYYRARIASGRVTELKRSPYQAGFSFHAITGKRDRNAGVFYGIGRALVDPQKWINKFFSTLLYAMMVGAKGGLLAEENAFADPRKAESEWANPSSITWLKSGALQKGQVTPKPAPVYPEGLDRLMQFTMNSLPQIAGLNAELMGLAERVQAGVVEAQRKQSAMAVVAWAFDAMRRYYRSMGRQMAAYVRDYMSEGTLVLVHGESGRQYVPLVKSQLATTYDVIVDEAPTSVNMRERVWAVLENLIPQMLQAGMAIPAEILDYSPIPSDLAEQWKKALAPDPQKQQIQEATVKATLDKLVAEVGKLQAGAQLDQAKAQEIMVELQRPGEDPQGQMQMEMLKAQVDAQVQAKISEFKVNREAETKLLVEQMKIESAERIAAMEAQIETTLERNRMESEDRLERQRMEHDASTKMTVAAITRAGKGEEEEDEEEEKPDPVALVTEAIGELREAVEAMGSKKVGFRIKRDKDGNMAEIETGDGRKLKVKRDKRGEMTEVGED